MSYHVTWGFPLTNRTSCMAAWSTFSTRWVLVFSLDFFWRCLCCRICSISHPREVKVKIGKQETHTGTDHSDNNQSTSGLSYLMQLSVLCSCFIFYLSSFNWLPLCSLLTLLPQHTYTQWLLRVHKLIQKHTSIFSSPLTRPWWRLTFVKVHPVQLL